MNQQESHVISQQVFGSSKKLQFIGLSPMDSLLNAINNAHPIHLPKPQTPKKRNMSIESMLDSNGTFEDGHLNQPHHHQRSLSFSSTSSTASSIATINSPPPPPGKRAWLPSTYDDRLHKHRRYDNSSNTDSDPTQVAAAASTVSPSSPKRLTTITCLHAAVAQKSYGSEKRFLCPPPTVSIRQHHHASPPPSITMSVFAEGNERPVEQRTSLDQQLSGSFKYLHVTGSAKAKQFSLRVNMSQNLTNSSMYLNQTATSQLVTQSPYATFFSSPISIISKPSKKTAKARNVSSCIFTTCQISLFNRINSQTVRTKYLTSGSSSSSPEPKHELCAKNASWSAFDIILVRQPTPPPQHTLSHSHHHYHHHHQPSVTSAGVPLTYGTEIILKDTQTGVCSPPVIIRKVDKNAISQLAFGPVSQMQKIALQLASSVGPSVESVYLSANGTAIHETNDSVEADEAGLNNGTNNGSSNSGGNGTNHTHLSTWLDYCASHPVPDPKSTSGALIEKVDDYLCWTIVGIAKFEYTIEEPNTVSPSALISPPSPSTASSTTPSSFTASSSSSLSASTASSPTSPSSYNRSLDTGYLNISNYKNNSNSYSNNSNNGNGNKYRQPEIMPRLLQPSPPPSPPRTIVPFPMVSTVKYDHHQHALHLVGQHLVQHLPTSVYPHLLEFWLGGAHGPLSCTQQQQQQYQVVTNGNIQLKLDLPHTQDFLVAHHDLLVHHPESKDRSVELPLLMVRKDNVVYHSGKSVVCLVKANGDTHWSISDITVPK